MFAGGCGADVGACAFAAAALPAAGAFLLNELGWTGVMGVDGVGVAGGSAESEALAAAPVFVEPFFCGRCYYHQDPHYVG